MRKLAFGLGLGAEMIAVATPFLQSLYRAFLETDASLVEINPLIVTGDGRLIALDAKMNFDDNALYRHKDFVELRDLDEEDPLEVEASKFKLNYIKLDGTVGCMVNGAGLAMATMDIIKLSGGRPANFLDVGGGASAEQVKNAFKILMSDTEVRGVFINIFGGILRCDVLATGVVNAARELRLKCRWWSAWRERTWSRARQILRESGLNFTIAEGHEGRRRKSRAPRGRCAVSVLVNEQTRVVVQGLTGREGSFHAQQMVAYGTKVVAGVTPGKGGTLHNAVPGVRYRGGSGARDESERSIIFVPPPYAADAVLEGD